MTSKYLPQTNLEPDGLAVDESKGRWVLEKHDAVRHYCRIFSKGMKKKWKHRVYLDLFCGSGCVSIKDTNKPVETSPIIALGVREPFTQYIFCEKKSQLMSALKQRVKRDFGNTRNVKFFEGKVEEKYGEICAALPSNALCFCFLDPYDLGLPFVVIKRLINAARNRESKVDFLILLALYTDAQRNLKRYEDPRSQKITSLLDDPDWRHKWNEWKQQGRGKPRDFIRFLLDRYLQNMKALGYQYRCVKDSTRTARNVPLYNLVFFFCS